MGHVVQIWRLPLEANVKPNLSNKGLGRDDKGRHFFFSGLLLFLSRLECLHYRFRV